MLEKYTSSGGIHNLDKEAMATAKRKGFSDKQIALLVESSELVVRYWHYISLLEFFTGFLWKKPVNGIIELFMFLLLGPKSYYG